MKCKSIKLNILISFTLIVVTYSFATANNNCIDYLSNQLKPNTSVLLNKISAREKIALVAQEVQNAKPKTNFYFAKWKKKVILRSSVVLDILIKMNHVLEELIVTSTSTDSDLIKGSARVLINFNQRIQDNFARNGISYDTLLKLSFLFASHIDMLTYPFNLESSLFTSLNLKKQKIRHSAVFFSEMALVKELSKDTFFYYRHTPASDGILTSFSFLYSASEPIIVVPTFSNLDFESLLWLQSRGIGVLGLTHSNENVDNREMSPLAFFNHDLVHASLFYKKIKSVFNITQGYSAIKEATIRYNRIVSKIGSYDLNRRNQKILFAILFLLFHESTNLYMNSDLNQILAELDEIAKDPEQNAKNRLKNSSSDLGRAFNNQPLSDSEIDQGLDLLKSILIETIY